MIWKITSESGGGWRNVYTCNWYKNIQLRDGPRDFLKGGPLLILVLKGGCSTFKCHFNLILTKFSDKGGGGVRSPGNTLSGSATVVSLFQCFDFSGDNSHTFAATVSKQTRDMDKAKVAALSKSKNAIVSAMTNVMFAAQHDIANTIVPELHQLCITQVFILEYNNTILNCDIFTMP